MTPFFRGNIILKEKEGGIRESMPRQVDKSWVSKRSGALKEEIGVWSFSRRKGQTFFSALLCPSQYNNVSSSRRCFCLTRTVR